MSQSNSVFSCLTCQKMLDGRKKAYKHILTGYGIFMNESLESKFLQEEMLI